MSRITTLHYIKLVYRSAVLTAALIIYFTIGFNTAHIVMPALCVWLIFMTEMLFKQLPSALESMGCEKQFAKNYIKSSDEKGNTAARNGIVLVALSWVALNAGIYILYKAGVIDSGMLVLISLAYSVCDMICVLYFCPFQKWIMKNRCCVTCRIYNWDYAMMFTPLIFIRSFFTWSLAAAALLLLIRWEVTELVYPERFSELTNENLRCANCRERRCRR